MKIAGFAFMAIYIATILGVNVGFSFVPMIETPLGLLSPMAVVVGLTFVLRDYAQRYAGHYVLFGMAIGAILSFLLADPFVAFASLAAFTVAEGADYLMYTLTKRPFRDRVLLSSLISTPLDTGVFLLGISGFTWGTFLLMIASKMVAAVIVYISATKGDELAAAA
ncbi:protein of unknown function DUF165 [Rhizobium phage RHph_X3_2]|nr:protein of unknown function DUF165 [Rhizobium phage RHph_X3_2]